VLAVYLAYRQFSAEQTATREAEGWGTYIQLSARSGPLHPGVTRSVRLSAPPRTATVRQVHSDGFPTKLGAPRFVVLSFNDAWGQGWVRTNGHLQRLPGESRFLPVLFHLRNPAMPWYRVIDEATWKAFHEAAGNPATLHEHLVDLLPNPELPWLTIDKSRERGDMVGRQTLRRRGVSSYTYHPRAIQRQVQRAAAFNDVQQFFDLTTRSDKFEVLY
jgi:hypothetical protein